MNSTLSLKINFAYSYVQMLHLWRHVILKNDNNDVMCAAFRNLQKSISSPVGAGYCPPIYNVTSTNSSICKLTCKITLWLSGRCGGLGKYVCKCKHL